MGLVKCQPGPGSSFNFNVNYKKGKTIIIPTVTQEAMHDINSNMIRCRLYKQSHRVYCSHREETKEDLWICLCWRFLCFYHGAVHYFQMNTQMTNNLMFINSLSDQ